MVPAMFFSLVNLEGKVLDSFRDEDVARKALRATVEADPALADELLVLRNEDDGDVAGRALMYADLADTTVTPGVVPAHAQIAAFPAATSCLVAMTATHGYVIHEESVGEDRLQGWPLARTAQPA